MANQVITIRELKKYYGKTKGVDTVSLSVEEGEIFGFLGSNGAGKSTTIRCLLGLIRPDGGQISLFEDRYNTHQETLAHIGYMPSETMFYPNMRVKDVIAFAAKARNLDCREEARRLCEILEVPLTKKIEDLSLGNRKKVAIVCALQHKPKLLICDEPTSGLDPLIQDRFFALVKEACANGATCFLSSHILSQIKDYCDRVAIIKDGRILRVDRVGNLTRSQTKQITIWKDGKQEKLTFSGSSAELLQDLLEKNPDDFLVEEPSLEELFMHYYQEVEE